MAKSNSTPSLEKAGKKERDAKAQAEKALIDARALATKYSISFTDLDKPEDLIAKVEEAKKNGVIPDGGISGTETQEKKKVTLGQTKKKDEPEYEDIEITTPEQLHELQESRKLHGFSGWFIEKENEETGETDRVPSKNEKHEYGHIPGAKAIVRVAISLILAFVCLFGAHNAQADVSSTDESVLGNRRWRVTSDGDLVPASDSTYKIGASGTEISTMYVDTINATTETLTSDLIFRSSLYANGRYGASSYLASSSTSLGTSSMPYSYIAKAIGNNATAEATQLKNGTPGQIAVFNIIGCGPSGSWTVTPVTSKGWSSITFNAKGQTATLLYFNDSLGWVVQSAGTTASSASPTIATVSTP